jgi:hypothetical protein
MKHLTPFNELRGYTYREAADKLKGMGHISRAKDLEEHSYHMEMKEANEKHGIGECTFQDGIVGKHISFDEYMSIDCFFDGGKDFIYFPIFFKFDIENYDDYIHQPFFIEHEVGTDEVAVGSEDPSTLQKKFGIELEGDGPLHTRALLLNNRGDANRVVRALRNFNWDENIQERPVFAEFKAGFDQMVAKLSVNQIWR